MEDCAAGVVGAAGDSIRSGSFVLHALAPRHSSSVQSMPSARLKATRIPFDGLLEVRCVRTGTANYARTFQPRRLKLPSFNLSIV